MAPHTPMLSAERIFQSKLCSAVQCVDLGVKVETKKLLGFGAWGALHILIFDIRSKKVYNEFLSYFYTLVGAWGGRSSTRDPSPSRTYTLCGAPETHEGCHRNAQSASASKSKREERQGERSSI